MIKDFGDKETEAVATHRPTRFPSHIATKAMHLIDRIDDAQNIFDLRIPPSNHLKKLTGKLAGYWNIRINDQWRIIFVWDEGAANAHEVQITDYH